MRPGFPPPKYDQNIRQAYKGGYTYLKTAEKGKMQSSGIVLDVNSLYPSRMKYSPLPYGEPIYFEGKYEPDENYPLYIQALSCEFQLRKGFLPTIQLKNNFLFNPVEYQERTLEGEPVALMLPNPDLELFRKHYKQDNLIYHYGWKFKASTLLFRDYVDYWDEMKEKAAKENNPGLRFIAKRMMNSLYGRFAINPVCASKMPYLEDNIVKYKLLPQETRDPIYLPVGVFVTAWARYLTINSAQSVYDRFIYSDTDSLHLKGTDLPESLEIDPFRLGAWKHESTFTKAIFQRSKCYLEEIDGKMKVTCAGLPEYLHSQVTWENFKPGASYHGKLTPEHVPGGIVLKEIDYSIKL